MLQYQRKCPSHIYYNFPVLQSDLYGNVLNKKWKYVGGHQISLFASKAVKIAP